MVLVIGFCFAGSLAAQTETEVNLLAEAGKSMRGGSTLTMVPGAEGGSIVLTVTHDGGNEGGGSVWFKVEGFSGPLSRITFDAKGTLGYGRIGVRSSLKQVNSVGVALPDLTDGMQSYSLDFAAAIQAAEAVGQEFVYPVTEVIIGFRYKDNPEDVLEISNLVLHAGE